nr:ribonuclease H-like domain-containing protein [Tanacetum cinerariifolium]
MRIEQYFLMTDYSLWEFILNGDSPVPTRVIEGVVQPVAPTIAEQRLARKNELKAREKMFGGNKETKKVQKTLLKQKYENFTSLSSESLDKIHDRLQNQSNSPQLDNDDLKQIDVDDLEEMDLKWQMVMLTVRARRFLQRTGRNLRANGPTLMWSPKDTRRNVQVEPQRRSVPVETSTSNALVLQCDGVDNYDCFDNEVASCSKACTKAYATLQSHYDKLTNDLRKSQFDVIYYKTRLKSVDARLLVYQQNETVFEEDIKLLKLDVQLRDNALVILRQKLETLEHEINDRYQSREGYHAVPPPYTVTFMPPKPDLVFHDARNVNKTVHTAFIVELSSTKHDKDLSHTYRPLTPIIEDWSLTQKMTLKLILPRMLLVLFSLLNKNHAQRGNHQHYARMSLPNPQRHVVSTAVLTKSKLVLLTAVRPVTTTVPQPHVTRPRPAKIVVTKPHSPSRSDINRRSFSKPSNFLPKVTTVKTPKVNVVKGVQGNWMCDKKNNVLFTNTECIVLSPEFKLLDENQVLLRVPRKNNMYNVDLKNIVPSGDLTCLFSKATLYESNLWHRRLGHINFKTMNKLVK